MDPSHEITSSRVLFLRLSLVALVLWAGVFVLEKHLHPTCCDIDWAGDDQRFAIFLQGLAAVRNDMIPNQFWIYGVPLMATFAILAYRYAAKAMKRRLG